MAMSVYKYLEDFDKLEKRLHDGHGGSASARSPLNMQDIRNKMDKFIRALGPSDLQVSVLSGFTQLKCRCFFFLQWNLFASDLSCKRENLICERSSQGIKCKPFKIN